MLRPGPSRPARARPDHLARRARASALLAVALTTLPAPRLATAAEPFELVHPAPRAPAVVAVFSARGGSGRAPVSAYLAAAGEALASRTELSVRSLEQVGVDSAQLEACPPLSRLSCWTQTTRAALGERSRNAFLIVVAVQAEPGAEGGEALSIVALDLEAAGRHLARLSPRPGPQGTVRGPSVGREATVNGLSPLPGPQGTVRGPSVGREATVNGLSPRPGPQGTVRGPSVGREATVNRLKPGLEEEVEESLFSEAIRTPPELVETHREAALHDYFAALAEETLRGTLERRGLWGARGALLLEVEGAPAILELDGHLAGTLPPGETRVRDVPAGRRELVVRRDAVPPETIAVVVQPGATARVTIEASAAGPGPIAATATWGGLVLVAAGVVVTVLAASEASGAPRSACLLRPGASGEDCEVLGAPGIGFAPDRAPSTDPREVNPAGIALWPLGAALSGAGSTWTIGTWLNGQDEEGAWIPIVAGLAGGALIYGTGLLLSER